MVIFDLSRFGLAAIVAAGLLSMACTAKVESPKAPETREAGSSPAAQAAPTGGSAEAAKGAPPKSVKTTLNRAVLFERLEKAPGDVAARRALTPLLIPDDRGRIALLLDKSKWDRAGYFQYVRWMHTVDPGMLAAPVQTALENVARGHPKKPVREWAVKALTRAPGVAPAFFGQMASKGSKEGLRAQIHASNEGFQVLVKATGGADPLARDAAYELLVALAKLGIELDAPQRVTLVNLVVADLATDFKEKPWRYLRAIYQLMRTHPKLNTDEQARLLSALRPYCLTAKGRKAWWDALLTVKRLGTPAAEKLIADAIASVPSKKGRRIMADRLSIE